MRNIWMVLALITAGTVSAQKTRRIDFSRSEDPRTGSPLHFRIDGGMSMFGCQGSYLDNIDWSNSIAPHQPSKPVRRGYGPIMYYELEVRLNDRLGVLAHYDAWRNYILKEQGNHGFNYAAWAETGLFGGRWYWGGRGKLYSGLMGGWCHHWSTGSPGIAKVNSADFAHQITLIGFRSGGPVGFTFELGQGYKGFLSTGLSVAF